MKAKIADIVIRTREVEVPDTCPGCGKDLSDGTGLYLLYMTVEGWDSQKLENGEICQKEGTAEWADGSWLPCVGIFCGSSECVHEFATGRNRLIDPDQVVDAVGPTPVKVWSRSLDRLVFPGVQGEDEALRRSG